jgi:hypothetical protein
MPRKRLFISNLQRNKSPRFEVKLEFGCIHRTLLLKEQSKFFK